MSSKNRDYWQQRQGNFYERQQQIRRQSGQRSYEFQEQWILSKLDARVATGATSRILDFGVGFGRMTRLLAGRHNLEYYGFDISSAMVEPLLQQPPEDMPDIADRIIIGDQLSGAYTERQFDIIFTISVLIHNAPEEVSAILRQMKEVLKSDGEIWLIENSPVLFSMLDNVWHDGCWVHDFVFTAAIEFDVEIDIHSIPTHGIYRLRVPPAERNREVIWRDFDGEVSIITRDSYSKHALGRTEQAIRGLESEVAGIGPGVGACRDDAELYRRVNTLSSELLGRYFNDIENEAGGGCVPVNRLIEKFEDLAHTCMDIERKKSKNPQNEDDSTAIAVVLPDRKSNSPKEVVLTLEARVRELESENKTIGARLELAAKNSAALRRRQHLLRAIVSPVTQQLETQGGSDVVSGSLVRKSPLLFDAVRDTRLAQPIQGFERVCHVMHQEWHGIRAAAGALPGRKLAISVTHTPTTSEIDLVARWFESNGIERVVIHGFSEAMGAMVTGLSAIGVSHLSLVWHGAPIMWMHEPERRLFFKAFTLARKGVFRRIQGMRGGTDVVLDRWGWPRQLLNMPPYIHTKPGRTLERAHGIALAPSWNLLHKNLTTNVLAAVECDCIEQVWVLAEDFALPHDLHVKIKVLPKLEPQQMLDTMQLANVVLNASLVDCHPMVELESLAVRTPAIRGSLFLDALEDHPYVKLTEVRDVLNVRSVAERISSVHRINRGELEEIMSDYERALISVSAARYSEFLEL